MTKTNLLYHQPKLFEMGSVIRLIFYLLDLYEGFFQISTHKQLCKRHRMEHLYRNANINVLFCDIHCFQILKDKYNTQKKIYNLYTQYFIFLKVF